MQKILWALMDDRRGSIGQALGVIGALNPNKIKCEEKNIVYTKTAALPNWIRGKGLLGLTAESKKLLKPPFPDYVLSISRRTVPVARYIKKLSPQTKLIQLMHPGKTGLSDFSLVVVPEHDRNKKAAPNIHYIVGCPHRITEDFLQQAKTEWEAEFAGLPKPLTAVIVGGAIKKKPFSEENALALGQALKNFKQKIGGSILITTSRRTGKKAEQIIMNEIKDIPQYTFLWGDTKKNPYSGFLACADNIIVTGDSVSMCCEATGTGKPIYLFTGKNWLTAKHQRFVQSLCERRCAALIDDDNAETFSPQNSLNAAREIAELIEKL
ncbi:MAG: mitochondrial fission ELM1 family protein [Alphaproteobacteria bacterium]|nr:mitochondrial fission ELM1 family protein [Alphaproteobacteria bacterium]